MVFFHSPRVGRARVETTEACRVADPPGMLCSAAASTRRCPRVCTIERQKRLKTLGEV